MCDRQALQYGFRRNNKGDGDESKRVNKVALFALLNQDEARQEEDTLRVLTLLIYPARLRWKMPAVWCHRGAHEARHLLVLSQVLW